MGIFKIKFGKFIFWVVAVVFVINLVIIATGKTYLYKGIQETYLKGKTGPGIYDSLVFPVRIAEHSPTPFQWTKDTNVIELSTEQRRVLNETNSTSFLIIQHGKIVSETYFNEHTKNVKSNTFSMAKSFIGLLIGIAVDEGKIKSLDDPISDYLPFHLEKEEGVTIRDLLGMSSGLVWSESGSNPFSDNAEAYYSSDLYSMMTKKHFDWKPGEKFEYVSGNSQLLGIILKEVTGIFPTEYFQEKIWKKIESEHDLLWSLDKEGGIEKTFCCGYATTRDYARMGQLILNKGVWKDNRIISESILNEIISPYNESQPFYGLHFWIFNHPKYPAVYYRGILGQYIVVIPSLDAVLVRTGHDRKGVYLIPENKKSDPEFVFNNSYKAHHPQDLFDYYEILNEILIKQ